MTSEQITSVGVKKWRWALTLPAVLVLVLPESWGRSGLEFGWQFFVVLPLMGLLVVAAGFCLIDCAIVVFAFLKQRGTRSDLGARIGIDCFVVGVFAYILLSG